MYTASRRMHAHVHVTGGRKRKIPTWRSAHPLMQPEAGFDSVSNSRFASTPSSFFLSFFPNFSSKRNERYAPFLLISFFFLFFLPRWTIFFRYASSSSLIEISSSFFWGEHNRVAEFTNAIEYDSKVLWKESAAKHVTGRTDSKREERPRSKDFLDLWITYVPSFIFRIVRLALARLIINYRR